MWNDLKEALRSLARDRAVTIIVVATLALAIGVNTTIFSALNGVLFRPLPYPDPDQLVTLFENNRELSIDRSRVSAATYMDWREGSRRFQSMAAYRYLGHTLTEVGEPERITSLEVSPALFRVTGIRAEIGRTFTDAEEQPGSERLAVLSGAAWQRRFGGDPGIIDRTIKLDGESYTVVGIMPEDFRFPADDPAVEVWLPLTLDSDALLTRPHRLFQVIGRLAPGSTVEQARAELDAVASQIAGEYPESNEGWGVTLVPTHEVLVGDTGTTLWFLFAAVTLVLLIGCANIANLLLARSTRRSRDYAVRAAFGAGRWVLLRRALAESVVLAGGGGIAGLLVAWAGVRMLRTVLPPGIPRADEVAIDGTVLLFTGGVAIAAGLVSGLAPALRLMRPDVAGVLQEAGRGAIAGRRGRWLSSTLVAVEVGLALVLLASAGLMIRSFARLLDVDPGFRTEGVVTIEVALPAARYPQGEQQRQFFETLMQRIRTLPEVDNAGAVSVLPMSPLGVQFEMPFSVAGLEAASPSERPRGDYRAVMPGYFEAMAIPILQGRTFDEFDGGDGRRVTIINQTLARRYFGDVDPVGRFVNMPMAGDLEIVGVVADVLQEGPGSVPKPEVFAPYPQLPLSEMHYVIQTSAAASEMISRIREEMRRLDPELPVAQVSTIDALLSRSFAEPRFNATLLTGLALCALMLAIVGIYGVVSYSVAQRTGEIGVRMALGAGRGDTIRMVVGEVLSVIAVGLVLGLAGTIAATRLIEGFLFGVTPRDPVTHMAVSLTLALAGVLAALLPASRAARVDPLVALRIE